MIWSKKIKKICFESLIQASQHEKDVMILHSALQTNDARYSYLAFSPFARFKATASGCYWNHQQLTCSDPWMFLKEQFHRYHIPQSNELPPFQAGAMGYFSYECAHWLHDYPTVPDPMGLPWAVLNFYDRVWAYDHHEACLYLIATGLPKLEPHARELQAQQDLSMMEAWVQNSLNTIHPKVPAQAIRQQAIQSNFSAESYQEAVTSIQNSILNGEIFQANLTQCFQTELTDSMPAMAVYEALCQMNPAPMSACLRIDEHAWIISSSPERFISLHRGKLLAQPIKGTRRRTGDDEQDVSMQNDLTSSVKDRAENIMIVDLMRNDLSKVARPGSVQVTELCGLHAFANVFHLISSIEAQLQPHLDVWDVLQAAFPPGSITGAPKRQAMKIISEHEQLARGPYCGCLGYWSFNGAMDTSVTIRHFVLNQNKLTWRAGGGIVLGSDPLGEYEESVLKAERLRAALHRWMEPGDSDNVHGS